MGSHKVGRAGIPICSKAALLHWRHITYIPVCFNQAVLDSDPIVRQHRVVLEAKDGHAIWVNSKVLEDISPLPENVEGGVIVRDASGKPTGNVILPLVFDMRT